MKNVINELIILLTKTQEELYTTLSEVDTKIEKIVEDGYILFNANNTPKPMLCVHLDTINTRSNYKLDANDIIVNDNTLLLSPSSTARCLGGDDRCGVWIALQILHDMESGKIPMDSYSVGFFCDEESGGIGSTEYSNSKLFDTINTTAYIGLDRKNSLRGVPEYATYSCDNAKLNNILDLTYTIAMGSFTDASNLADSCDIACVNLSIGYNNEHTRNEYIRIEDMVFTYNYLLTNPFGNDYYNYTKASSRYYDYSGYDKYFDRDDYYRKEVVCEWCGSHEALYYEFDEEGNEVMLCKSCKEFI